MFAIELHGRRYSRLFSYVILDGKTWNDIEIATDNLNAVIEHYQFYLKIIDADNERDKQLIIREHIGKLWLNTTWLAAERGEIDIDKAINTILLKEDMIHNLPYECDWLLDDVGFYTGKLIIKLPEQVIQYP